MHNVKAYDGIELEFHTILTTALYGVNVELKGTPNSTTWKRPWVETRAS
jgi:hypothetical protein